MFVQFYISSIPYLLSLRNQSRQLASSNLEYCWEATLSRQVFQIQFILNIYLDSDSFYEYSKLGLASLLDLLRKRRRYLRISQFVHKYSQLFHFILIFSKRISLRYLSCGKITITGGPPGGYHEMPQNACEKCLFHVIAFS